MNLINKFDSLGHHSPEVFSQVRFDWHEFLKQKVGAGEDLEISDFCLFKALWGLGCEHLTPVGGDGGVAAC